MKKKNINPLSLDKETIARLDEKQMEALAGGANDPDERDECTCILISRVIKDIEDEAYVEECDDICCGTKS